jgi:hypothetical protein
MAVIGDDSNAACGDENWLEFGTAYLNYGGGPGGAEDVWYGYACPTSGNGYYLFTTGSVAIGESHAFDLYKVAGTDKWVWQVDSDYIYHNNFSWFLSAGFEEIFLESWNSGAMVPEDVITSMNEGIAGGAWVGWIPEGGLSGWIAQAPLLGGYNSNTSAWTAQGLI